MAMNFSTSNFTFRQLMGNGLSYRVPPFQRDYSWTEEEWDDLWQDILGLFGPEGETEHYMGYLVLQSSDNRCHEIIDGQQRLTTLSVMILAVLKHLNELADAGIEQENNRRRSEQLRSSYIGYLNPVTLVSHAKLELNRHNNRFYQNYLVPLESIPQRGLNVSEHQLRKAFLWFFEQMKKQHPIRPEIGKELAAFLDTLVDKLFFTVITVSDEINAFKVFETLNARGIRLSAADLLKNYLFSLISDKDEHELELKNLEESWENIVGQLEKESFEEYLRIFWNSRHKLTRKTELFKTIKKSVHDRAKAFELLRGLDHAASIYAAFRDATDASWNKEEKKAIDQLRMFGVQQPLSMLLACHNRFYYQDRQGFTQICKAVSTVSFRYNVICNLHTGDQERVYNDIAVSVSDGKYSKSAEVTKALSKIYPDDQQFKDLFSEKEMKTSNARNKRIVYYMLFEMERQFSGQDFDIESDKYSLEHILPEHPSEVWDYIEESTQEHFIYRLGNMGILEKGLNREANNDGYATKRDIYQKSAIPMTKDVAEQYDTWDERKIAARQKQLAKLATSIWKIVF
jgi:hypothetical protein